MTIVRFFAAGVAVDGLLTADKRESCRVMTPAPLLLFR